MFCWLIGTCNLVLKFLVRFSAKISSKHMVYFAKMSKIWWICLKIDLLILWIDLDHFLIYSTLWTHISTTFHTSLNRRKDARPVKFSKLPFLGSWIFVCNETNVNWKVKNSAFISYVFHCKQWILLFIILFWKLCFVFFNKCLLTLFCDPK